MIAVNTSLNLKQTRTPFSPHKCYLKFARRFKSIFQQITLSLFLKASLGAHPSYENEISFTLKLKSFSYEWLCTRPHFDRGLGQHGIALGCCYQLQKETRFCESTYRFANLCWHCYSNRNMGKNSATKRNASNCFFFVKFCYFSEMYCLQKPWLLLLRKLRMYKSSLFYKIKWTWLKKAFPKKLFPRLVIC